MERAGIAKLLEAEARAKEIIEAAKKERTALQKQSKLEADQSIAEFKASKDAEYKKMTSSVDTSDYAKTLNAETDREIEQMKSESKKTVEEIAALLLHHVSTVDATVHKNKVKA